MNRLARETVLTAGGDVPGARPLPIPSRAPGGMIAEGRATTPDFILDSQIGPIAAGPRLRGGAAPFGRSHEAAGRRNRIGARIHRPPQPVVSALARRLRGEALAADFGLFGTARAALRHVAMGARIGREAAAGRGLTRMRRPRGWRPRGGPA